MTVIMCVATRWKQYIAALAETATHTLLVGGLAATNTSCPLLLSIQSITELGVLASQSGNRIITNINDDVDRKFGVGFTIEVQSLFGQPRLFLVRQSSKPVFLQSSKTIKNPAYYKKCPFKRTQIHCATHSLFPPFPSFPLSKATVDGFVYHRRSPSVLPSLRALRPSHAVLAPLFKRLLS